MQRKLFLSIVCLIMTAISLLAQETPEACYLVGVPSGWSEPKVDNYEIYQNYRLDINANGEYEGVFDVEAGDLIFRIYTELTGWDGGGSYGSQEDDYPIVIKEVPFPSLTDKIVKGKGVWDFVGWLGGKVKICVNLNDMTITVSDVTTGIDIVERKDVPTEYYDLQGVYVNNPKSGLFIRRQGDKVDKVIVR